MIVGQLAHDVRDDVHDVAVALDHEFLGRAHGADPGDAADVVPAKIEEHQVLGQFLLIREEIGFERAVLFRCRAPRAGAGDRADRHLAIEDADEDFRAGADDLKAAEIEVEHEGRGVGAPKAPVECKGRQGEGLRPALRGDDLKDVAGGDVVPRLFDRRLVGVLGEVRYRLDGGDLVSEIAVGAGHGSFEVADRVHDAFGGLSVGGAGREPGIRPCRGDDDHLALYAVQNGNNGGPEKDRVGQSDGIGVDVGQMLDKADHVVAEIAEETGGGGGQPIRQVDPAFGDQGAERGQRIGALDLEGVTVEPRGPVHARLGAVALPDQVGFHTDDRITATHLAPGHAFQHEGIGLGARELEHQ